MACVFLYYSMNLRFYMVIFILAEFWSIDTVSVVKKSIRWTILDLDHAHQNGQ